MDFEAIRGNLPVILLVIGLILIQILLRRGLKPRTTPPEIAQNLLAEVRLNQALIESFDFREKPKKFEAASWQRSKDKLDFLSHPLQRALSDTFMLVEEFNQQIDAAKKYRSDSYLVNINVARLKEPLAKSRQGLEEWLMSKTGTGDSSPQVPGVLDDLLGKR